MDDISCSHLHIPVGYTEGSAFAAMAGSIFANSTGPHVLARHGLVSWQHSPGFSALSSCRYQSCHCQFRSCFSSRKGAGDFRTPSDSLHSAVQGARILDWGVSSASPVSECWAFGATSLEMVTGAPLFSNISEITEFHLCDKSQTCAKRIAHLQVSSARGVLYGLLQREPKSRMSLPQFLQKCPRDFLVV